MRPASISSENGRRALRALVGLAFVATLGCDNSMNFNPVAPEWPDWQPSGPGTRTLQIDGVLQIEDGACLEATVLYDGQEVEGARFRCPDPSGCAEVDLEASVLSATGHHTVSFLVLRQSREVIEYRAEGTVRVSRDDVDLGGGVRMPLGPTRATLQAGGAVTFDVLFIY